jgi:hypothetical protein
MIRKLAAATVAAATIAAMTAAAAAAAPARKVPVVTVGDCVTEGSFVSCSVQGDISHPHAIYVKVWASPRQSLLVSWLDSCQNGASVGDRSGQYNVTASASRPSVRRIALARGASGSCTPVVSVALNNGYGHEHLELYGTN